MVPTIFFSFVKRMGGQGAFVIFFPFQRITISLFRIIWNYSADFLENLAWALRSHLRFYAQQMAPPLPNKGLNLFVVGSLIPALFSFMECAFSYLTILFPTTTLNIFFFGWLLVLVVLVDDLGLWFVASGLDTFFFLLEKNPLFKEKQRIPNNTKFFFRFLTEKPLLDWL